MNFLKEVLNINVRESKCNYSFPNYINVRYKITEAYLDDVKVFFFYPKEEIESINMLKKHIGKVKQKENITVVLILSKITARERKKYIKAKIPFIVNDKQSYLPFMGTLLTERCDVKISNKQKIIPSAQVLLFYFIYHNAKPIYIIDARNNLEFSAMSISRAVNELNGIGLIKTHKEGVKKIMACDLTPKELFEKAMPYLSSPIKRKQYIFKKDLKDNYYLAGDSALSEYSMLNPPNVSCYATSDNLSLRETKDLDLLDDKNQIELEIWKYKPCIFSKMNFDVLSVIMTYEDSYDSRIIEAKEDVLQKLWSIIDG